MDLIGSVKYIENRLGERKPDRRREKTARKHIHTPDDAQPRDDADLRPEEPGSGIGRTIDVSA